MPLLDHFRPPWGDRRDWHSFHNLWAGFIAGDLNRRLPEGYFAESNVQFGIEIDVAAFEEPMSLPFGDRWTPPGPTMTIPFPVMTDSVEVLVYRSRGGQILAGAIDLVSPSNKDRPTSREAFVSKCETYLKSGLGLAVIDVVTELRANLHDDLMSRPLSPRDQQEGDLYLASYRAVERDGDAHLDIWLETLTIGEGLPILPFWIKGGLCFPIDLEETYHRTRAELRMADGA